jgi:hypothetical protein
MHWKKTMKPTLQQHFEVKPSFHLKDPAFLFLTIAYDDNDDVKLSEFITMQKSIVTHRSSRNGVVINSS